MKNIRILWLATEALFSIVALATENYWLFIPALVAAVCDYALSRPRTK
jgi:hypothetical protein